MRIQELQKRLRKANRNLDIIIYGTYKQQLQRHLFMCSVTLHGEHLYSMKQIGEIPMYPRSDYGIVDAFSGQFIRRLSVYGLARKLLQRKLITSLGQVVY